MFHDIYIISKIVMNTTLFGIGNAINLIGYLGTYCISMCLEQRKWPDKNQINNIKTEESGLNMSISIECVVKEVLDKSIQAVIQEAKEYLDNQKFPDGKSYRNAIINTLLLILYEKSHETEEHSRRMEKYCHSIGSMLQLSSKEMNDLSILALLHDIGKACINSNTLKKPGSLTLAEWEEMKRHTENGYQIVRAFPELSMDAGLILSHHEHWDGNGYPRGLKGDEIPTLCRILSVIDAFDAMTNDRAYRKAMIREEAIYELKRNAGTQFDPEITDLFIKVIMDEDDLHVRTLRKINSY